MKKVLFNLELIDRHYCFFLDDQTGKMFSYAVRKNSNQYLVTKKGEIDFLNKIIKDLNNKYVRRKDVLYKNEYYARYINAYNQMNYFAKIKKDGSLKACTYDSVKELYDFYNEQKPMYERRKYNSRTSRNQKSFEGENAYSTLDPFNTNYSAGFYDDLDYGTFDINNTVNQNLNNISNSSRKKKSNLPKIVISIALATGVITLSMLGHQAVSRGVIPFLSSGNEISEETKQLGEVQNELFEEQPSTVTISNETDTVTKSATDYILERFGNVDLEADNEEKQALKSKYDFIQSQLEEIGLSKWEIAIELESISLFDGDDISFYFDTENDEIIQIYQKIEELEKKTSGDVSISSSTITAENLPSGVQEIIDAIESNENLSENEKSYIISKQTDSWVEDYEYLNIDELVQRYSMLSFNYDYKEDGQALDMDGIPYTSAVGKYDSSYRLLADGSLEIVKSTITLWDSTSDQDLETDNKTASHEIEHVDGKLSLTGSTLLNEGTTCILADDNTSSTYKYEQLMSALMIETFGMDTIKEAYYNHSIENTLANKIVEATGSDRQEVLSDVYDLLENIEQALYKTGDIGDSFREDTSLIDEYKSIYSRLESYYEKINGRSMSDNAIATAIQDYVIGEQNLKLNDGEYISNILYQKDGTASITVATDEGELNYQKDLLYQVTKSSATYKRNVVISQNQKYSADNLVLNITDELLDYADR